MRCAGREGRSRAAVVAIGLVLVVTAPVACSDDGGDAGSVGDSAGEAPGRGTKSFGDRSRLYLEASDQASDGMSVIVKEVRLSAPGWVALHSHSHAVGAVGPVIGVSALLAAGPSTDVPVTLYERIITATSTVYPMLHFEDTDNAVFDYPDGDGQASLPGIGVAVLPIRVTVG